ncbi:DUF2441 domain-containing protein [Bosea sp. (in: a-proteobacteria)]|uniref:DUF2441 domain-containing protein n=1 Tax=Bosea sp. (in: a-proteobacteria) TaxID=1871050 RepID=UPI0011F47692|nr:DUF2441 domain-containing protein [Bosea sp. (in: a-proteobacteria)]TAJ29712.1 MAG: DUF2441 domain-containing protein [Bosea sp. (in: a-proteobacteria)]
MIEDVTKSVFFHVTRPVPWNEHQPLKVGDEIAVGHRTNPFFGFYEIPRTIPVQTPDGQLLSPILTFLSAVRDGRIAASNLAGIAHDATQHYLILARELIWEEVRCEVAPTAPSRQRCIWLSDTVAAAEIWKQRLGGDASLLTLECTGTIARVDAGFLLGDAQPLSETYANARSYWQGSVSKRAEPETLFRGKATVMSVA